MLLKEKGHVYYEGLDSFRGIGIIWIICCHYFPSVDFFRFGWVSLEFFFVLSGFLITKVLLSSDKNNHFFSRFYIRRALRIFPIYYLFIILFFGAVFLASQPHHFVYIKKYYPFFFVYMQNLLFVFVGEDPEKYLNHLWSLAMEEQFYFLWPLAIYYIRDLKKLKNLLWAVIIIVFIIRIFVWWRWGQRFETYHFNTITRIDTIAFGCLLGCGFSYKQIKAPFRISIIVAGILIFATGYVVFKDPFVTNPVFATLGYSVFSLLAIFFLDFFITEKNRFRFLKTNWLVNYLGQISYCMYLIHIPLYLYFSSKTGYSNVINGLLFIGVTIIVATVSYYLYEIKFLKLKRKFPVNLPAIASPQ